MNVEPVGTLHLSDGLLDEPLVLGRHDPLVHEDLVRGHVVWLERKGLGDLWVSGIDIDTAASGLELLE